MSNDEMVAELEQKLKTLQLYHAAALADSVARYGNEGVLDKVAEQKRAEQMKGGAGLAARFGINEPKQAIEKTRDTYGCADWVCTDTSDGFEAVATHCSLCAISKQLGHFSPCRIYCLSPMEAMIIGVAPEAEFSTLSTLWDSDKCKLCVKLLSGMVA